MSGASAKGARRRASTTAPAARPAMWRAGAPRSFLVARGPACSTCRGRAWRCRQASPLAPRCVTASWQTSRASLAMGRAGSCACPRESGSRSRRSWCCSRRPLAGASAESPDGPPGARASSPPAATEPPRHR
eukprot:scaffold427_cov344-Prasinococcus_capsulatus_cf.AAC.3